METSSHSELNEKRAKILDLAISAPTMAVDTETNGQDIRDGRGFCIGISIAFRGPRREMCSAYYPVAHTKNNIPDTMRNQLEAILMSREILIMHNAKFDIVSLRTADIDIIKRKWWCSMVGTHFMNENLPSKGLDWLSKNLLKHEGKAKGPDWEWAHKIFGWSADFPSEIMNKYACTDAEEALELYEQGFPDFVKAGFTGV